MRIPYFDFLKGVAIIMVVAIHCMSVAYKNTESVDFLCFFIRNLMNVAVPIFLSVSGFFVAKKSFESASDFIGYLKKQIPRVYFPVLFCSIPFAIAGIVKGRILSTLVMYFTCGYSIYYFIEVIIQCYLTVFLLNKKWAENYKLIYGSGFIAVFCWTVKVYAIDGYLHIDLPLVLYAGGIWMWYVFFAIGFFIGKMQVRRYSLRPFIWFTPVCFLLCVMESCLLNSQGKFAGLGQHPSSILFSVFLFLCYYLKRCSLSIRCVLRNVLKYFLPL